MYKQAVFIKVYVLKERMTIKMKKKVVIGSVFMMIPIIILFITQLEVEGNETNRGTHPIPVNIVEAEESTYEKVLSYVGVVTPEIIQPLSFKSTGKIANIHVNVGDQIDANTLLVTLDTEDLEYQLRASKSMMDGARAQYQLAVKGTRSEDVEMARLAMEKAKEVSDFKTKTLEEFNGLYSVGAISSKELDGAKLEKDLAMIDYKNATAHYDKAVAGLDKETIDGLKAQFEQAEVNYEHQLSLIEDSQLYATVEGTVIDILYEENQMVQMGKPVIIIRENHQVIEIGVTDEDLQMLNIGQSVHIVNNGQVANGEVIRIAQVPDKNTHLYEVVIEAKDSGKHLVGAIVACDIIIGTDKGIKVPMKAIVIDEQDYVYIVKDNHASKRVVEIRDFIGDQMIVSGIKGGEYVVIENVAKLYEGTTLQIID